jgi:Asp-tRNA(Asn)/Glu-tRNA(Gln) amidotransferase A subunit family amidase
VREEVQKRVVEAGDALARDAGLQIVDVEVTMPTLDVTWAMANLAGLKLELGDRWPDCKDEMTTAMAFCVEMASTMTTLDVVAAGEQARIQANEAMADLFDQVDFVICATNPDVAFPADLYLNTRVGEAQVEAGNNGALTIPANISGNPAISIPIEPFEGLPVGMQIIGKHHQDALILDLGAVVERERPWPLVAPGAPH